MREISF